MENNKILQAFRLKPKIVDLINKYAKEHNVSRTAIVEYALIKYFKSKNEDIS